MKKLLIVTYGGGHSNIIHNLYPHLCKNFDVIIFALTTAEDFFENKKIKFNNLEYYASKLNIKDEAQSLGQRLIKDLKIDYSFLGFEKTTLYYGVSGLDCLINTSYENLLLDYLNEGRKSFLPIRFLENIIDFECPNYILTTNSPRFERASILAAKNKGIISFSIEDLLGDSRLISTKDPNPNYIGDYIFVMNEMAKANLIKKGFTDYREIYVTGQPIFDSVYEHMKKKQIDTPKHPIKVLWLSQHIANQKEIFHQLVDSFKDKNDFVLYVKPHPNENYLYMKEFINHKKYKNIFILEKSLLLDYIANSNVVLTQFSTAGFEAIAYKKSLFVLNLFSSNYPLDYVKLGLAVNIKNIDDLFDEINTYLFTDKYKIIKQNVIDFLPNISASNEIVKCINHITKTKF